MENIFKIYEKPYPFEFGDGWGLFVFHKYFVVDAISHLEYRPLYLKTFYISFDPQISVYIYIKQCYALTDYALFLTFAEKTFRNETPS